uniref:Rho GDP-dissociation inhibitor 3 n=1 Tax=Lynceus sp. MCZ IZ 141354 TaxID=1930659 RepID=A0A9N6WTH6_9CRUS|nr:EOG090X0EJY [Lynceus sp. MCZ IZ 141354]
MSDENLQSQEEDVNITYVPPPQKSLTEILAADQEDESLRKYKEALLGSATSGAVVVDERDPRKVIVRKLVLISEDREMALDLTGDISKLKSQEFVIKEGVQYRIRIDFHVQKEIVHGLKYVQKTYRHGIQVDKMTQMVGSYAPKPECHSYTTPVEDAPSGMMSRGHYTVTSLFTDDDKNEHLKWEWAFEIKKDWK